MALLRTPMSARVTATLDLTEIVLKLSHTQPPMLEARGRLLTKDRGGVTGRYSEVAVTLKHLPPSALAFIADMKAALSAKTETTEKTERSE